MFDAGLVLCVEGYRDDIEAKPFGRWIPGKMTVPKQLGGHADSCSLFCVDAPKGGHPRAGAARTNLDDHDDVVVARHQVHLESPRAHIAPEDFEPLFSEVFFRKALGPIAERFARIGPLAATRLSNHRPLATPEHAEPT